jgi:hypothetical protein
MCDSPTLEHLRRMQDQDLLHVAKESADIAKRDKDKDRAAVAARLTEHANAVLTERLERKLTSEILRARAESVEAVLALAQGRF